MTCSAITQVDLNHAVWTSYIGSYRNETVTHPACPPGVCGIDFSHELDFWLVWNKWHDKLIPLIYPASHVNCLTAQLVLCAGLTAQLVLWAGLTAQLVLCAGLTAQLVLWAGLTSQLVLWAGLTAQLVLWAWLWLHAQLVLYSWSEQKIWQANPPDGLSFYPTMPAALASARYLKFK
jgi:hypothetical protein